MRHKVKRFGAILLTVLLSVSLIEPAFATKVEVDNAKKKVTSLEQEKKKVEATLKSLEGLKSDAAAYVKKLDAQLETVNDELDKLSGQITEKEADIVRTQQELEAP